MWSLCGNGRQSNLLQAGIGFGWKWSSSYWLCPVLVILQCVVPKFNSTITVVTSTCASLQFLPHRLK